MDEGDIPVQDPQTEEENRLHLNVAYAKPEQVPLSNQVKHPVLQKWLRPIELLTEEVLEEYFADELNDVRLLSWICQLIVDRAGKVLERQCYSPWLPRPAADAAAPRAPSPHTNPSLPPSSVQREAEPVKEKEISPRPLTCREDPGRGEHNFTVYGVSRLMIFCTRCGCRPPTQAEREEE